MFKKRWVRVLLVLLVLGGIAAAASKPLQDYAKKRNQPEWRLSKVKEGDISSVVNSSGEIKPVLSVSVGAFVSGPVTDLYVEFNQEVKKDELMAKIDPRLYTAAVAGDKARLITAEAEVSRVTALLGQAKNNESRAKTLAEENPDFVSPNEMDQLKFNRMALDAQLLVAKAQIESAKAALENSTLNVEYTEIRAPVDGIVIDRKIDPGQTLASQFQTPELFIVAPNMREKMHVFASVDEADIGRIRAAQERGEPVQFTVDAYPDDLFEGKIEEVRYSSTTTQSVVTYPVVVAVANPELKLLPGMTADITFRVDKREGVVRIPNAALRYYPDRQHVREADHKILDGSWKAKSDDEDEEEQDVMLSAEERAKARREQRRRHVWLVEGEKLKAVEVVTGLSDGKYTEMVEGDLKDGQELVTGVKRKGAFGG